jgi:hypothetical protein
MRLFVLPQDTVRVGRFVTGWKEHYDREQARNCRNCLRTRTEAKKEIKDVLKG